MRRALRLQHRIVIPFVLVALIATAVTAYVALSVASRTLEARVQAQILSAAAVVSRSDLALNPAILRSVQEITGAHVVTYATGGQVLATTIDAADRQNLLDAVQRAGPSGRAAEGADTPHVIRLDCGAPCFVAYRRVVGRPDTIVALIAETSELTAATRAVTRTILLAAVLSVVAMVLVSQAIARRVTGPLDALVSFARQVSPQDPRRRAAVSPDEVGRLAAAFNDMLDRLERAQDALVRSEKLALAGLLASRVAHDIRNPLSSIKMQTQLLQSRLHADREHRATLGAILHDIEQVESVIRDLLELARPGELKLEPAQLNVVIRDVLEQMRAQLTHRRISTKLVLDDALPDISLDHGRLKQAFVNVLANASDAMHTGGTLSVTTRAADGGVSVQICDDGVGVDPRIIDRVFEPFVSTKPEGTGLGLVNAKAIVESHGGRIRLERRHPKGTCADIWLPAATITPPASVRAGERPHG